MSRTRERTLIKPFQRRNDAKAANNTQNSNSKSSSINSSSNDSCNNINDNNDNTPPSKSPQSPSPSKMRHQNMISNFLSSKIQITPKHKAVFYMSLCMGIHFSGHEFARAPITSLFTSKDIGFKNSAALPLAVGVVCPFSIIMLYIFKKVLQHHGPRHALMQSTLVYASCLFSVALALNYFTTRIDGQQHIRTSTSNMMELLDTHMITKSLLFAIFVFQSANVQFLYTQHWSFLGSILTAEEGKVWFAPIAGLGSVISTLAAANVAKLVDSIGLIGLLCCAALVIGSSSFFADQAYSVARKVRIRYFFAFAFTSASASASAMHIQPG